MTCNWMPFGFENDLGVTGNTNGSFSEQIINIESFGKTQLEFPLLMLLQMKFIYTVLTIGRMH